MSLQQVQKVVDLRFKQLKTKVVKGQMSAVEARLRLRHKLKIAIEASLSRFRRHVNSYTEVEASCTKEWLEDEDE